MRTNYFTCLRRKRKYCRIIQHYIIMLREKRETALQTSERNLVSTVDHKKKHAHMDKSPERRGFGWECHKLCTPTAWRLSFIAWVRVCSRCTYLLRWCCGTWATGVTVWEGRLLLYEQRSVPQKKRRRRRWEARHCNTHTATIFSGFHTSSKFKLCSAVMFATYCICLASPELTNM